MALCVPAAGTSQSEHERHSGIKAQVEEELRRLEEEIATCEAVCVSVSVYQWGGFICMWPTVHSSAVAIFCEKLT